MILRSIFEGRKRGIYVDVGAHHPRRFSNTYYFFRKGWRGVNIDATPGSMALFKRLRPRDINLECAIAKREKQITFYMFEETALNTFDAELASARERQGHKVIATIELRARTLRDVLKEVLPAGQKIDFMTIDVEGRDHEVLKSNDWVTFRPEHVLVECLPSSTVNDNRVLEFMKDQGYTFFAKTVRTYIFKDLRSNK